MENSKKDWFGIFAKILCIAGILYVYVFIIADWARLNPNDDGDGGLIGMILGFFPTVSLILYILFSNIQKLFWKRILVGAPLVVMVAFPLFFTLMNAVDGFSEALSALNLFAFFLIRASILLIPLIVYLIYFKTKDEVSFLLLVVACVIVVFSAYPAKNYIEAWSTGNSCDTKRLIMKGYSEFRTEVHGDVVCITKDRGYPSETYKWEVLRGADAKTFENLNGEYSRDKNTVFYNGQPIKGADPATFQVNPLWKMDGPVDPEYYWTQYTRDKSNIYFKGERVLVKNIDQFRIIDLCHSNLCATDGTSIFKEGKILSDISSVDTQSLKVFNSCEYSKDSKKVYYSGVPIKDSVDVKTFNIYGGAYYCYAFDNFLHLYYKGQLVPGANPITFKKINPSDPLSPYTDGDSIYYDGKRLNLDMDTFKYLGKGVSKDLGTVYNGADRIEGADAATFELIHVPQNTMNVCAKDKNHEYFDGEVYEHPLCKGEKI